MAGEQTIFLLHVTSSDLAKRAVLDGTHISESKTAVFAMATAVGDLDAGCM